MPYPQPAELAAELTVVRYPHQVTEGHTFCPDHPYPELVWLPLIGPSTLLLWRCLARAVLHAGDTPVTLPTVELLAGVGLGTALSSHAPGARTIARMIAFDLAQRADRHGRLLAVRTAVYPVPQHRLDRLPRPAREYHRRIIGN
jgi:hypothetical protein